MPILPAPNPALGMMVFLLIVVWAPSVWAIVVVAKRDDGIRELAAPVLVAAALILGAVGYGVATTDMEVGDVPDALKVLLVLVWPPVAALMILLRGGWRLLMARRRGPLVTGRTRPTSRPRAASREGR